jgi:hypothetical protein
LSQPFDLFIPNQLLLNDITLLDIAVSHTLLVATLPFHHRDPFDRLLIAQSLIEGCPLISTDSVFDAYGSIGSGKAGSRPDHAAQQRVPADSLRLLPKIGGILTRPSILA